MKSFLLTFASHFKVTYYEERMLEVEDELGRVKEDRRQASIQVKNYFIPTVVRSRLARSLSFAAVFKSFSFPSNLSSYDCWSFKTCALGQFYGRSFQRNFVFTLDGFPLYASGLAHRLVQHSLANQSDGVICITNHIHCLFTQFTVIAKIAIMIAN